MRYAIGVVVLGAIVTAGPAAQTSPAQSPNVERLGPQVGEIVPDFSATDQSGRTRTLQSMMGAKGLMLVFNRSADW
jgi:hypothetical protein